MAICGLNSIPLIATTPSDARMPPAARFWSELNFQMDLGPRQLCGPGSSCSLRPVAATYLDRKSLLSRRHGKKPSGPNSERMWRITIPHATLPGLWLKETVNAFDAGQTVQSWQEAPCSTTQRESSRPGAGRACASGTSQESSPECGNRSRVRSEPHATGISATRAHAEAGTRVGARSEAHHEALFRIKEHAYQFQATQCRPSAFLSSGGV